MLQKDKIHNVYIFFLVILFRYTLKIILNNLTLNLIKRKGSVFNQRVLWTTYYLSL